MPALYLCGAGNPEGVRLAITVNRAQCRWDRIILLDDDPAKQGYAVLGVEVAGPIAMLEDAQQGDEVVNLIARSTEGRAAGRRKIAVFGVPFATLIHPSVETAGVTLAAEITVYQNATLGTHAEVGESTVVFMGAIVGHGSRVGRGCIVAPNAVINARAELGDGVYVGTNSSILPEVRVGSWSTIAAGSAVMNAVPDGATAVGVPAKVLKARPEPKAHLVNAAE